MCDRVDKVCDGVGKLVGQTRTHTRVVHSTEQRIVSLQNNSHNSFSLSLWFSNKKNNRSTNSLCARQHQFRFRICKGWKQRERIFLL